LFDGDDIFDCGRKGELGFSGVRLSWLEIVGEEIFRVLVLIIEGLIGAQCIYLVRSNVKFFNAKTSCEILAGHEAIWKGNASP